MSTMFWVWLAAAVIFLILELMSPGFLFACFVVGSAAAMVFGHFNPDSYYWQVGIFIIVTLGLLPFARMLAKKITKPSPQKSNVDALIGQVALVTKTIDPDLGGQVKVEGEVWSARADETIEAHEKVRVMAVTGAKVHVQKITE